MICWKALVSAQEKVGLRESTSAGGVAALIKIDVYFESVQEGRKGYLLH